MTLSAPLSETEVRGLVTIKWSPEAYRKVASSKGQLISKGLFGVIVSTKKPTSFLRIYALASKKSSKQKTLLYNYDK